MSEVPCICPACSRLSWGHKGDTCKGPRWNRHPENEIQTWWPEGSPPKWMSEEVSHYNPDRTYEGDDV